MQNFCYLVGDEKSKECLIVDPAWASDTIMNNAEKAGYKIKGFFNPHAHYDHTNAIPDLLSRLDVPVYANENEIAYSKSGTSIVGTLGKTAKGLQAEDIIRLGETEVKVLHTPGHTPGS